MRKAGLFVFILLIGLITLISATRFLSAQGAAPEARAEEPNGMGEFAALTPTLTKPAGEGTAPVESEANSDFIPEISEATPPTPPSNPAPARQIPGVENVDPEPVFGAVEQLVIPGIKLDTEIVNIPFDEFTWDVSGIGQRVGRLGGMQVESENNLILAGHVTLQDGSNGPLRYLFTLTPGENILVYSQDEVYTFVVREMNLVYPDEISVTTDTRNPQLTLITCETWDPETLTYLRRRIILADLEKVEPFLDNMLVE